MTFVLVSAKITLQQKRGPMPQHIEKDPQMAEIVSYSSAVEAGLTEADFADVVLPTNRPLRAKLESVSIRPGKFGTQAFVEVRLSHDQPRPEDSYVGGEKVSAYLNMRGEASEYRRMCNALGVTQPLAFDWKLVTGANAVDIYVRLLSKTRTITETSLDGATRSFEIPTYGIAQVYSGV